MNNGPTIFWLFQSTLPGWGATSARSSFGSSQSVFQSTLPGWGATEFFDQSPVVVDISIHAPRMGSDSFTRFLLTDMMRFQSTLPGWGATKIRPRLNLIPTYFNPRSPDGERRCIVVLMPVIVTNFNPRSPDGERPSAFPRVFAFLLFQSTLPGWGATLNNEVCDEIDVFQSTLPGWGATWAATRSGIPCWNFNPRSPDGERLGHHGPLHQPGKISIHAPRMGSDEREEFIWVVTVGISIHAPRMGSD